MADIGHKAWAIAHEKWPVLGQKLKMPKRFYKILYDHIRVVVCKKPLLKTPNIQKMRVF